MIYDLNELKEYRVKFKELLLDEKFDEALKIQNNLSPFRLAKVLMEIPPNHTVRFIKKLSNERTGRILMYFPANIAMETLKSYTDQEKAVLLENMPAHHAADILYVMNDDEVNTLHELITPELNNTLKTLLKYDEGTAGSAMSEFFLQVSPGTSVKEALEGIKDIPGEGLQRSYIYVIDKNKHPQGVVSVKDLVRSDPETIIDKVMTKQLMAANVNDKETDAAQLLRSRRYEMIPVLNDEGQMLGVITLEDALEILEKNMAGQFMNLGGNIEESFFTPPLGSVKKRLPWMMVNVFLNLGAVAVIASFEETIEAVAILAVFLPMITDMGGNVGIQSLSVSIRSIALGEVRLSDYLKATKKEVVIGLINGLALGLLFSIIALLMMGNMTLGLVAGAALTINVFIAGIVGGTLPFLIKKIGKDPAMMTGPVLTTITDITGVSVYLGLSTMFLASLIA